MNIFGIMCCCVHAITSTQEKTLYINNDDALIFPLRSGSETNRDDVTPRSLKLGKVVKIMAEGKWKKKYVRIEGPISTTCEINTISLLIQSMWGMRYLHRILTSEQFHSFSMLPEHEQKVITVSQLLKDSPLGNINKIYSCFYVGLDEVERVFMHESWLIKCNQKKKDEPKKSDSIILNSSSSSSDEETTKDTRKSHNV